MFLSIAFYLVFHVYTWHGTPNGHSEFAKPKGATTKDLLRKLSRREAVNLFGEKYLIDSSSYVPPSAAVDWHERLLDSLLGRKKSNPIRFRQVVFAPVMFEGEAAKVTILFFEDTSYGAIVEMPYPFRLRSHATPEDFDRLRENIVNSIGEPTVSTETYIDYMEHGTQTLFGTFKDGKIAIDLWRVGY